MKLALLCTAVILLGHQGYCQDDLDKLRKNIPGEPGKDYPINGPSILCKINPGNPGCPRGGGGGGGGAAAAKGNGGNGGGNRQNGKQNQSQSRPQMKAPAVAGSAARKNGNGNRRNGGGNNGRNNGAGNKKLGNQNQGGGKRNNGGNQQNEEGGDELDALRKNIPGEPGKDYPINGPSILCKINPNNPGCPPSGGGRTGRQNGGDYQAAVARGEIPGVPGKDYPVNSVDALRKKGFGNIELAPASLITPDYPGLASLPTSQRKLPPPANRKSGSGGNNRRSQGSSPRSSNGGRRKQQQQSNGDSYCPGGSLEACIGFCPSDSDGSEYGKCANDCGKNC